MRLKVYEPKFMHEELNLKLKQEMAILSANRSACKSKLLKIEEKGSYFMRI